MGTTSVGSRNGWRVGIDWVSNLVKVSLVHGFAAVHGLDLPDSFSGLVNPKVTAEPVLATIEARGIGGSVRNALN
jgi:hypothetical protein